MVSTIIYFFYDNAIENQAKNSIEVWSPLGEKNPVIFVVELKMHHTW